MLADQFGLNDGVHAFYRPYLYLDNQAIADADIDPAFLTANTVKFAIDGTPGRFAFMEAPYLDGTRPDMNYTPIGMPGLAAPGSGSTESNFYFMPRGVDDPETAYQFLKFFGHGPTSRWCRCDGFCAEAA